MIKTDEMKQLIRYCDEKMNKVNGKLIRWICTIENAQAASLHENLHKLLKKQ